MIPMPHKNLPLVRLYKDIDMRDVASVGGKNASLGEMFQHLTKRGIRIPDGFATTADAFRLYVTENQLDKLIRDTLKGLNVSSLKNLRAAGLKIRQAILKGKVPQSLEREIIAAYRDLSKREGTGGRPVDVAVRSSATAEDLPGASFAGQQDTYLNIHGEKMVIDAVRRCFASLFTDRAIAYRQEKGFDHLKVALSCGVQKMVRSDKASAGVMFTIDTESGFRDAVLINAAWGLGESVVQGKVSPDQYFVFKPLLAKAGLDPIINRRIGAKERKIIYAEGKKDPIKTVAVPPKEQRLACLTDAEILTLAKWGMEIESYYSALAKTDRPMDIEWAKDGVSGRLYIVQARPETVQAERDQGKIRSYKLKKTGKVLAQGLSIGSAIGKGVVRVVK